MITKFDSFTLFGSSDANTMTQITDVASRARYAALMPDCDSSDPNAAWPVCIDWRIITRY